MIEEFVESALIIDNDEKEVEGLVSLLRQRDVCVKHLRPSDLGEEKLKNRKIIFLDLSMDDSRNLSENIAFIRQMFAKNLGNNYGTYGIVLWTNHSDYCDEFRNKIQGDSEKYTLPLFVIDLDKARYLKEDDFEPIFDDLDKRLKENTAANFFMKWFTLVNDGRDKAITSIFSLVQDYQKQNDNLRFVLFQLARSRNGIPINELGEYPLYIDALRAFNDMMNHQIISQGNFESEIFSNIDNIHYVGHNADYAKFLDGSHHFKGTPLDRNSEEFEAGHSARVTELDDEILAIYSGVNSKLLLDRVNLAQEEVLPGNIYEIVEAGHPFRVDPIPNGGKAIVIEMTPPCDFAQGKKKNSKILGGFICEFSRSQRDKYKKENYYHELWPVSVGRDDKSMIVFDFRYFGVADPLDLKNPSKFKLIFRSKESLFADILQKLSSFNARLGLSVMH